MADVTRRPETGQLRRRVEAVRRAKSFARLDQDVPAARERVAAALRSLTRLDPGLAVRLAGAGLFVDDDGTLRALEGGEPVLEPASTIGGGR